MITFYHVLSRSYILNTKTWLWFAGHPAACFRIFRPIPKSLILKHTVSHVSSWIQSKQWPLSGLTRLTQGIFHAHVSHVLLQTWTSTLSPSYLGFRCTFAAWIRENVESGTWNIHHIIISKVSSESSWPPTEQLKRWNRETISYPYATPMKIRQFQPCDRSDAPGFHDLAIQRDVYRCVVMICEYLWCARQRCGPSLWRAPPTRHTWKFWKFWKMRWNDIKHGFRLKPTATPFGALQRKKGSFKVCSRAASIWGFLATKMPGRSDGSSMAVKTFRLQLHATVSYNLSSHAKSDFSWTLEWNVQIISPKNLSKHVKTARKVVLVGFWKTERTWINRLPPQVWNYKSGQEQICWSNGEAPLLPHGWSHSLPSGTRNDMTKRSETSCPHYCFVTCESPWGWTCAKNQQKI